MKNNTNYQIALPRIQYNQEHLTEVMKKMAAIEKPRVFAIWSEAKKVWMALDNIDACYWIKAAKELGKSITIVELVDEEPYKITEIVAELEAELYRTDFISFAE